MKQRQSSIMEWWRQLWGAKQEVVEEEEGANALLLKAMIDKVYNYEIRIRKAINTQMQGDFHSVFKGTGLEFDDVRAYQYGDDVRHIDWNVSAKGHGAFIKTFKEEKEQQIFFLLDVSESQEVGSAGIRKIDVAKEICGVLALSGIKESSAVGLLCFSDQKERYVKADKGRKHGYRVINELLKLKPLSKKTNINAGISLAMSMLKRKGIVVIISDFLDDNYERPLKAMARTHDLVVIHLVDPSETEMPNIGIAPVQFKEGGEKTFVNTSGWGTRNSMANYYREKQEELYTLCARNNANYLQINTQADFVPQLIKLFKVRNSSRRKR